MDLLSEVLRSIQLEGAVYLHAEFTSPWCASAASSDAMAEVLSPNPGRVISYHLLLEGHCHVELPSGEALELHEGEVLVLPHGDAHLIWHGNKTNMVDRKLSEVLLNGLQFVQAGGGGERVTFICGYLAGDPHLCNVVLAGLPRMLKVNIRDDPGGQWLENSLRHSVKFAPKEPGSAAVLAKISEALFAETLRRFLAEFPEELRGWMAGARHPEVGRALSLLHQNPRHPWTIAELAQEVGVSRSALAERFSDFLGEPPITYLARWRLNLGAQKLRCTSASVAEIAAAVGYESEPAFNRAFRRAFAIPPARFRKEFKKVRDAALT